MLVLFETSSGYAIFKLLDERKLEKVDDLYKEFESPESANKVVKLKHFSKFGDMTDALAATTATVEGKMGKGLKKLLKKVFASGAHDTLAVADSKLGNLIKEKFDVSCLHNNAVNELMRCIRLQRSNLITGLPEEEINAMSLGLAHSLSRYKLKFSPDKVDTMVVQAISLLDDLDKELNNYVMRCREWYGWHFPELGKLVSDNLVYAKTVKVIGMKENCADMDLSSVLPEEVEAEVKEMAEVSMGTEISQEDICNIIHLCDQIIQISEYRTQLYDYLKNRMMAIAPNLTIMVGELVGARLIAHAGSLMNLAKHPSSTVQILGAEKALFRALKTKHDTPKYGLIYHASLVGQTSAKNKGKISRMLAAKTALAVRYDALGEDGSQDVGIQGRAKIEDRLRQVEQGQMRRISGTGKALAKAEKFEMKPAVQYNPAADSTLETKKGKKRKLDDSLAEGSSKKTKKEELIEGAQDFLFPESVPTVDTPSEKKKKKKKRQQQETEEQEPAVEVEESSSAVETAEVTPKKKKKKHHQTEEETTESSSAVEVLEVTTPKKKKKKEKTES
ncbi:nucleolar protein 58-like [Dysidea avara]|uniref:nucleolar protein 58-like n=1 Tax=Dysidea avara TaxID=196820 RepID=UPI00332682C5